MHSFRQHRKTNPLQYQAMKSVKSQPQKSLELHNELHHLVRIINGEEIQCGLPEIGYYPNDVENQKACSGSCGLLSHCALHTPEGGSLSTSLILMDYKRSVKGLRTLNVF